ncbi:uncharacterized protein LOC135123185 [Zophobas morio]|uniref:uncharacterized protein LOC135123185 n=1 Tax=Zophobas morio TaxID=2755281 RepID=UPI00308339E5
MPTKCCVPNCRGNCKNGPRVSTFIFPKSPELRSKWLAAIKRNFEPSQNSRKFGHILIVDRYQIQRPMGMHHPRSLSFEENPQGTPILRKTKTLNSGLLFSVTSEGSGRLFRCSDSKTLWPHFPVKGPIRRCKDILSMARTAHSIYNQYLECEKLRKNAAILEQNRDEEEKRNRQSEVNKFTAQRQDLKELWSKYDEVRKIKKGEHTVTESILSSVNSLSDLNKKKK